VTSDIRTVRHIESAVRERANCARDSHEHSPGSIDGCPVVWRTEMLERLRALDVCGFQPAMLTPSKLPQGDLGPGGILEAGTIKQHVQRSTDAEPLIPPSVVCPTLISLRHTSRSSSVRRRKRQRYLDAAGNPMNLVPWGHQRTCPLMNKPCTV